MKDLRAERKKRLAQLEEFSPDLLKEDIMFAESESELEDAMEKVLNLVEKQGLPINEDAYNNWGDYAYFIESSAPDIAKLFYLADKQLEEVRYMKEEFESWKSEDSEELEGTAAHKKAQLEDISHDKRDEIVDGAARALFVSLWADLVEEAAEATGERLLGFGVELMDVAPETPQEAKVAAESLISTIESTNAVDFTTFVPPGTEEVFEAFTGDFGHYLAMEALGSGVGWSDDHEEHGLELPLIDSMESPELYNVTLELIEQEFGVDFNELDKLRELEEV